MARAAFIGIGVMGAPMARHLLKAGHTLTVYNRTQARAQAWQAEHGGEARDTIAGAVEGADFVACCVSRDEDVRAVFGAAKTAMKRGALFVDHSTTSARLARELAAGSGDVSFLDAPVSGGQAGAEAGRLTVMIGGEPEAVEAARPFIGAYGANITHIGPSGAGQLAKMVNQICIAGVVQGLAEGLAFAKAADIDPAAVIAAISKGAAQSWQMENRWKTMIEGKFDFGFAVELMRKDLGLVLDEARGNGSSLPLTALVNQFYAELEAMGGARWDTSSLIARLPPHR